MNIYYTRGSGLMIEFQSSEKEVELGLLVLEVMIEQLHTEGDPNAEEVERIRDIIANQEYAPTN